MLNELYRRVGILMPGEHADSPTRECKHSRGNPPIKEGSGLVLALICENQHDPLPRARRGQFFALQPARKSRTSSPAWKTMAGAVLPASAILRLISSKSAFTQPTLETSISPSWAIQKMVGTLVRP